jgi:hypothetical protein
VPVISPAAGWGGLVMAWAYPQAARPNSANDIGPGVLGFLVVAAMGLGFFFLMRSMNKHLRRVRAVRDAGLQPGTALDATQRGTGASSAAGNAMSSAASDAVTPAARAGRKSRFGKGPIAGEQTGDADGVPSG